MIIQTSIDMSANFYSLTVMIVWVVSSESIVNIVYLALLSNNEIVTIVSEEVTSITANVNCVGPTDLSIWY